MYFGVLNDAFQNCFEASILLYVSMVTFLSSVQGNSQALHKLLFSKLYKIHRKFD